MSLKDQLIRLGSEQPELRDHIRPVLATLEKTAADKGSVEALMSAARQKALMGYLAAVAKGLGKTSIPGQIMGRPAMEGTAAVVTLRFNDGEVLPISAYVTRKGKLRLEALGASGARGGYTVTDDHAPSVGPKRAAMVFLDKLDRAFGM